MGYDEYLARDNFFELDPPLSRNGEEPEIIRGESSQICVDAALDFLRSVRSEGPEPFFLTLWFASPHSLYRALPRDAVLDGDVPGKELANRFAEITAMDRVLGAFRQALREMGEVANSLLWFTSDNGITLEGIPEDQRGGLHNGVLRGQQGWLCEGGLRVPGIIAWPSMIREPRRTAMPASTTDIFTTLLARLGLEHQNPNRPLDGLDLTPLILEDSMSQRPPPIGFRNYDHRSETENPRWMAALLT